MTNYIANYICQVYSDASENWNSAILEHVSCYDLMAEITSWNGKEKYMCNINDNQSYYTIAILKKGTKQIYRGRCYHISNIAKAIDRVINYFKE